MMRMIRKILKVEVTDGFVLECEMENGDVYEYDMSFVSERTGSMIQPLKDIDYFKKVFIELGCLTWPNGFNTDGGSVAVRGKLISKSVA